MSSSKVILLVLSSVAVLMSVVVVMVDSQQVQDDGSSGSIRCPTRCLCFRSTVRCMFLQLDRVPQVPSNTTILYVSYHFFFLSILSLRLALRNPISRPDSNLNGNEMKKKKMLYTVECLSEHE